MSKGEAPFDLAKAHEIFMTIEDTAAKGADLFPPTSKTGDTAALPKVWEDMADFRVKFGNLGAAAKAAREATKDFDTFKASFRTIGRKCSACHGCPGQKS